MNRFSSLRDNTAQQPRSATGTAATFRCGACEKFRLVPGRKKKRVRGLLQYVCAECFGG